MTWKQVVFVTAAFSTATAAAVGAQEAGVWQAGPLDPRLDLVIASREPQGQMSIVALDPVSVGRAVPNAPYSAEAVTEITQTLADGNRIEQRTSAIVARDSRGRIRREQHGIALGSLVAQNEQPIVTITDPATGTHVTLNYGDKVAFRAKPARVMTAQTDANGGVATFSYSAGRPADGAAPAPPAPAPPPNLQPGPREDVFFTRPALPAVGTGPVAAARFEGDVKTEKLEPRTIEGLNAEGTRTTMTIPAGAMGNTLPIEVVSEQWYSPELGVVLMTRRSDPRFGETIYRLINIDRSEPSPDLFAIPADFKIEELRPGRMVPPRPEHQ